MAAVSISSDLGAQENKTCHCFHFSPRLTWSDGTRCYDLFWMLSFKPVFLTVFFHPYQEAFQFFFTFCHLSGQSVQLLSHVQLFATPWITAHQASLSVTNSQSLLKRMSIESVMPSSHLILSSPSPPAPNPSQHQSLFQWVNSLHQMAKVLELQL